MPCAACALCLWMQPLHQVAVTKSGRAKGPPPGFTAPGNLADNDDFRQQCRQVLSCLPGAEHRQPEALPARQGPAPSTTPFAAYSSKPWTNDTRALTDLIRSASVSLCRQRGWAHMPTTGSGCLLGQAAQPSTLGHCLPSTADMAAHGANTRWVLGMTSRKSLLVALGQEVLHSVPGSWDQSWHRAVFKAASKIHLKARRYAESRLNDQGNAPPQKCCMLQPIAATAIADASGR